MLIDIKVTEGVIQLKGCSITSGRGDQKEFMLKEVQVSD